MNDIYVKIIVYAFTIVATTAFMYMMTSMDFKSKAAAMACSVAISVAMMITADSCMGNEPIVGVLKAKLAESRQKPDLDSLYMQAVLDATGRQQ